jgi:hypothetical protein
MIAWRKIEPGQWPYGHGKKGTDGITAKDIMEFLPQTLKNDRADNIDPKYYEPTVI